MMKRALGIVLLFALIVGTLLGGVIAVGFDVSSFDDFLEALKSLWSALLEILAG